MGRKNELIWRTINFNIYYDRCTALKINFKKKPSKLMEQRVNYSEGGQKKILSLIHHLLEIKKIAGFPEYTSSFTLASSIYMFLLRTVTLLKLNFVFWKGVYQCTYLLKYMYVEIHVCTFDFRV